MNRNEQIARRSKMRRSATIRDVARLANVSVATVSRFLNGHITLSSNTVRRIDKAVEVLNYRPNHQARMLSLGRSKTLGIVVPDVANPFFSILIEAAEDHAFSLGYSLIVCNSRNDIIRQEHYLSLLYSRQVDGLVLMPASSKPIKFERSEPALVVIDEDIPGLPVPKLFVENQEGGFLATSTLIKAGHTRIAFLGGPPDLLSTRERYLGFKKACELAQLDVSLDYVFFGPYETNFATQVAIKLLSSNKRPTAIFASSDIMALGVMQAASTLNFNIPQDLSLVGFDDIPFAQMLSPGLTTVRQPIRELGREAIKTLIELIHTDTYSGEMVRRFPIELVERSSIAPVSEID